MDIKEVMQKSIHALLSNNSYDDLNEEQNALVVEFQTELWKPKVDELRKTMSPDKIKEVIHDWWLDYKIADGTEDNLLAYVDVGGILNIIVFNCDDRYVEYEWDSKEAFVKDMGNNNENIPMLDDVLIEVNTQDNDLLSWRRNIYEPTVDNLLEECKREIYE